MKKKLLSILLTFCMVLTLLPTVAFAEDGTSAAATEVQTETDLRNAVNNSSVSVVKLTADIRISTSLTITRAVTLDLNNHVLNMTGNDSVIKVEGGGNLTLTDSAETKSEKMFTKDESGLWTLNATGNQSVTGGVITGGKVGNDNNAGRGGGVYVGVGTFNMSGGSIVGCTAATTDSNYAMGGGVYVSQGSTFTMSGGSIAGCTAVADKNFAMGGGIRNEGTTTLSGKAEIRDCQATGYYGAYGGGISDGGTNGSSSTLNISGNVKITGCTADGTLDAMFVTRGTISGGTFDGTVTNNGTITGGTFNGTVTNGKNGKITGGTFKGEVTNNGTITGGTFNGGITGTAALATGSGTETAPYQISTAEGLKWFRDKVNSGEYGVYAVLEGNIDLGGEAWTPIAPNTTIKGTDYGYCGIFDGGGYTISGLNIPGDTERAGLFGVVTNGTIKNLTVAGSVAGSSNNTSVAGGIVGKARDNSTIEACANLCSVSGQQYVGGIAGMISSTTVRDCYNVGKVAGGIVGMENKSASKAITNCYNVGSVSAKYAGGILGRAASECVSNCYYLERTAKKAIGSGDPDDIRVHAPKTETEFADGTVLKLLKAGERGNYADPWADECKYLAAAGKTLPVFKGQGDAHTHTWGAWTSNGDGTRTRTCPCGASETVNYSNSSSRNYYTIQATAGTGGAISPSGKVSVREGRDQVFTITPDQGYAVSDVKIDGESVGAVTSYSFENVRKAHTIAVSFAKAKAFVDVPAGSYYEDAVNWAVENGITQGTDDTHFSPDDVCTRAQMVTFLWRAAGSPKVEDGKNPFVDVKADAYYYDAVLWAVEQGVTSGTSATTFSPDATVTRGQTVTFLYRNAGSPDVSGTMPFADVEADAYYAKAVLWAVEQKITTGTSETTFSPTSDCTRGQIVTFLYRAK